MNCHSLGWSLMSCPRSWELRQPSRRQNRRNLLTPIALPRYLPLSKTCQIAAISTEILFHANDQSARPQATKAQEEPKQVSCSREMPPKTGCLFAGAYDDAKETELGVA